VRAQELVQLAHLLLLGNVLEGGLEAGQVVELARREKVEEVEELLQVVLQRRARQQHLVVERVVGEDPEELGLVVFEPMGLVHHQNLPLDRAEAGGVDRDELVGGEQDVELDGGGLHAGRLLPLPHRVVLEGELVLSDDDAVVLVADIGHHVELGGPEGELPLPVDEGGEGHGDEEGAAAMSLLEERVEEGDGLDGLAEPHLVCQDDVFAVAPGVAGTGYSLQLVGVQG